MNPVVGDTQARVATQVLGHKVGSGVGSVHVGLDILEMLANTDNEMGVTEIAQRISMAKASVFRHLSTLVDRGYLLQNPKTNRYHIGARFFLLSRAAPKKFDLVAIAKDAMENLRDRLGQTIVISLPSVRSVVVLATVRSENVIEIGVRPGSELSLHASAQGKIALAYGSPALWKQIPTGELPRLTEKTITSRRVLQREIETVKKQGWAVVLGEGVAGINTIAVPIIDLDRALMATLAIVGSMQFVAAKQTTAEQVAALKLAAAQIERKLASHFL